MKINFETKFNIGDKIFFMDENRINQDVIQFIRVSCEVNNKIAFAPPVITYTGPDGISHNEDECFATKELLCEALMNDNGGLPF